MIIGIMGSAGAGKDTLGRFFIERGFARLSFAAILKDVVSNVFGWERHLLEGDTDESRNFREEVDHWWSSRLGREVTPRKMLQEVGTEAFRNGISDQIWVACLERQMSRHENVVITDCRFISEIEMLRNNGAKFVLVWRDADPMSLDLESLHDSERQWIQYYKDSGFEFDSIINNAGTIEQLYQEAEKVYDKL